MSRHPKLEEIKKRMAKCKDFQLTRTQYIKLTGIDIPQNKTYTETRSAIAKAAKENGYEVEVIEEIIKFRKKG